MNVVNFFKGSLCLLLGAQVHGGCCVKVLRHPSAQFGSFFNQPPSALITERLYKEPSLTLATLCDLVWLNKTVKLIQLP